MLQISTGRLFSGPVGRENLLRGTLYTNAVVSLGEPVETEAGRLLPSSIRSERPHVLVYELVERMEEEESKPAVLVSSTVDPYLRDFAVVVSFALNCTCTPEFDHTRRLTGGNRMSNRFEPQKLVRRFFDDEVWCKPDEVVFLTTFTKKLISLPRVTFLGVMRALRTYINGMHRISDDLELAYTLLVVSVESLAQEFDGHVADWESFDERKRGVIDAALAGADSETADKVRAALLSVEHVSIGRRFREFSIAHTTSSYFRDVLADDDTRLGRSQLSEVLGLAYQSRSKYVHQLQRLPDMVTMGHRYSEVALEGRATHLTLQGLARLMRGVIINFVMQQPSREREPCDYRLQRSGVVHIPLAPKHWVGRAEGDIEKAGRDKLEGFLQQLASCMLGEPNAVITDMRHVLERAADFIPGIEKEFRLPYLTLHFLYSLHVPESHSVALSRAVKSLVESELAAPGSEALIAHVLSCCPIDWPLEVHQKTLDTYLRRRASKSGLRFPRVFEAAVTLDLAERYRLAGAADPCRKAIALAVENHPGHQRLLEFEESFKPERSISWQEIMLPARA